MSYARQPSGRHPGRTARRHTITAPSAAQSTGEAPHGTVPIGLVLGGVQKAATSTLYRVLVSHQHITRAPQKEWHFFDDDSLDWERPDFSGYQVAVRSARSKATMGVDATPSYLFWPGALERIHAWNPDVPLIFCFRDPIERAFSHWVMNWTRRLPAEERITFAESVRIDFDPSWVGSRPEGWDAKSLRTRTVVARGFYGAQLARVHSIFPREQVHLVDFHQMVRAQHDTAEDLVARLGLPPYKKRFEPLARSASQTDFEADAPTADDIAVLRDRFADDHRAFSEASGLDTSGWTTSRLLADEITPGDVAEKLGRKAGLL